MRLEPMFCGPWRWPRGYIVKAVEHGGVHIVAAAHTELLRLAGLGSGDKLVGEQQIPGGGVDGHVPDGRPDGIGIAFNCFVGEEAAHMGRLDKGQQPEVYFSVLIGKGDR